MQLSVHDIMATVANAYGLGIADLRGQRKSKAFSHPRMIAMWLAAELLTDKSLPQLGRAFKKDHTTVMHARSRARIIVSQNLDHIKKVTAILADLKRIAKDG